MGYEAVKSITPSKGAAPRTSEVTSPTAAPLCAINFDLIAGGENYLSRLAQQRANEEAKKRGGYR
jgi:hypothetical protein